MVVLDLSDDVLFGVFANVTAEIPTFVKDKSELFARVNMHLLVVMDLDKGTFHTEGQLTPKPFILFKDCNFTYGFALC